MAAALLQAREARMGRRLSELLPREVLPHLAQLERCRRQHRLAYLAALSGMLAGIFLVFLLVQNLQAALLAGAIVLAAGLLLMRRAQRGYLGRVRDTVMPAICGAIGDLGHSVGAAPDLNLRGLAQLGLVPRHNREELWIRRGDSRSGSQHACRRVDGIHRDLTGGPVRHVEELSVRLDREAEGSGTGSGRLLQFGQSAGGLLDSVGGQ